MKRQGWKTAGWVWAALVGAFLYLPLMYMMLFSVNSTKQGATFTGVSFQWFARIAQDEKIVQALATSIQIALASASASVLLGLLAALALTRLGNWRGKSAFEACARAPMVMPDVILGIGLLLLFISAFNAVGAPERGALTIFLGHTLLGFSYAMSVILVRLQELPVDQEQAAADLGARPLQTFWYITLPGLSSALVAAFLLTFTLSFDDVVISEFLSGPGTKTLSQVLFAYSRRGVDPTLYAIATVIIVLVSCALIGLALYLLSKEKRTTRLRSTAQPS